MGTLATCPPLPVITTNRAVKADYEAADAHFLCMGASPTGKFHGADDYNKALGKSRAWIFGQLARHAKVTPEGQKRIDKTLADAASLYGPASSPSAITTPRILSTPAPQASSASAPARAIDATLKSAPTPVQPIGAPMTKYATLGSTLGTIVPGVGTATGGVVGGLLDAFGGFGGSKCPGPFNYNPRTGGCDPKPGRLVGSTPSTGQCPAGSTYDPGTGQCKVGGIAGGVQRALPGGQTGYVDPVGSSWTATSAYGLEGFVPQAYQTQRLACPPGYVLFGNKGGRNPGMEVCLPKGFLPNRHRKWPKPPRPAMSAGDIKTLNRIAAIQRKVSNMAQKAGYRKPVRK